jgi:uncharacterized repeat protein (TIGR01451 family)
MPRLVKPATRVIPVALALAAVALISAVSAGASVTPQTGPAGALAIAQALASSANVTGASFQTTTAAGTPNGTSTSSLGGFPTDGSGYGILTTGNVSDVDNTAVFANTNNGGAAVRGDTDRDVTVLKTDISVPTGANCLTFDFKFLSEEYPGFVATAYNDAFIAELDSSTWTTSGSTISAPNNFAFDSSNNVVSVNSTGLGGMSAANGAGTAFNGTQSYAANGFLPPGNAGGATGLLHASTQVSAGAHSVSFSIFDQGDNLLDSAVFLDNLAVGFVPNPAVNCKPGATPVNFKLTLTPATATNPVGTAHTVTATLTDTGGTPIANGPISFTVTGANTPSPGSSTTDANGKATFTYTGTNTGQDQIAACYDADSSPPCEATASATKDWTPVSDVKIAKSGSANAVIGGQISYTLTVINSGPSSATNVVVSDPVPAGATLVSATPSQGTCNTTVSCNLGTLANGNSSTIIVVLAATTVGTVTNTGSVSADEPDPDTTNNSAAATTNVYGFAPGGGAFVVGDKTAAGAVTFWGAQWWRLNILGGGAAPAAFKGYALNPAVPSCGTGWSTDPGNSAPPPAGPLPAYIAVIVATNVTQSGSQISGNTAHIVIVKTNAGYDPNAGHAGTGTVIATIC